MDASGIAQKLQSNGSLLRCQHREELTGYRGGQFFEEHRAIVGSHAVEQGGNVFVRHGLEEVFLLLQGEVLENGSSVFSRKDAEDDDLIFDSEFRQHAGQIARMAISRDVAKPRVIASSNRGNEFVGRTGDLPNCIERFIALRSCKFLFHLCQCRTNNIVMMNVWTDGLHGIEPHAMNEVEVTGDKAGGCAPRWKASVLPLW